MVAFRGTESTADWLSTLPLASRELPGLGRVHGGRRSRRGFHPRRPSGTQMLPGLT
jgi:hypothetical protein